MQPDERCHWLPDGNPDPEIEFTTEHRLDDWTNEELEAWQKHLEEFRNRQRTLAQIAAVNFALHQMSLDPLKKA